MSRARPLGVEHRCRDAQISEQRYGTPRYVAFVPADEGDVPSASDGSLSAQELVCSAKGCRSVATVDLSWRNPRLHDAMRTKHWLACDEHADHLADFLASRGFLLDRRRRT
jgi:hypothetical protein